MKVLKWVEFPGQEISVDVSIEDIQSALDEVTQDERCGKITSLLSACLQVMKAIDDIQIKELPTNVKEKIVDRLKEQIERYKI
jgi:hypothetical protein